MFAGSGAIAIEFLSRGAEKAYICDNSQKAISQIEQNLEKTKLKEKAIIMKADYKNCLKEFFIKRLQFDIIYLDPPYKGEMYDDTLEKIGQYNLLKHNGIIIIETDEENRREKIENNANIKYQIYDFRKYGRAYLIFLK